MFDIPMKSSGPMSLSEMDNNNFAKNAAQPAPMGQPASQNFVPNQTAGFEPTPMQSQGGFNPQPQTNFGASQPQGSFAQPTPMQPIPMQSQQNFNVQTSNSQPAGGGVILKKGQKTSLTKMSPNLDLIEVGLGWDLGPGGQSYDLDVEAFLLNNQDKVLGDDWFVFYNQPASPDGSVRLLGDNRTGAGDGDDEIIQVKLSQVNPGVNKIMFIVTINEALEKGYNFSNVSSAYVRIVDKAANRELVRFNLTDYYNTVCSMMVGEVYKRNGEWRFNPVGDGVKEDLTGLCTRYGVNIAG